MSAAFLPPHPDEIEPRPAFEKKPLVWEEDVELYSRFMERKVRGAAASLGAPFPGQEPSFLSSPVPG